MDFIVILQAGVGTGTILLFATLGELFTERSGVLNLGVEGMMLIGAMSAFSVALSTGNPWLGVLVAMLAGGLISQIHAFITITLQADQVVSGLALTFLGTGISLVLGEGLSKAGAISLLPKFTIPLLSQIPLLGPVFFTDHSIMVYIGYLIIPLAWYYIYATRPGMHLRAVGEYPAAADALGINVYRLRYFYVFVGGVLAGLAGATISLAVSPGWFSETDHRRSGLDCGRSGDFCTMGPVPRRFRCLYLWRFTPSHPGYPGSAVAARISQSFLLQPVLGIFPANAALCVYHHRAGDWFARSDAQTSGRTCSPGKSVYSWGTRSVNLFSIQESYEQIQRLPVFPVWTAVPA